MQRVGLSAPGFHLAVETDGSWPSSIFHLDISPIPCSATCAKHAERSPGSLDMKGINPGVEMGPDSGLKGPQNLKSKQALVLLITLWCPGNSQEGTKRLSHQWKFDGLGWGHP